MAGFEQPLMLVFGLLSLPAVYLTFKNNSKFQKLIGGSRALIILVFALAAAQPFIESEQKIMEEPKVTVLVDESSSAELLENKSLEFEQVEVDRRTIASGNSSDLRNGILRNIEENSAYVTVSDFQSNTRLGSIAEKINRKNSTLNALKPEADEEASVSIKGPESTVPGAENSFTVKVSSTSDTPKPEISLNGEVIEAEKTGKSEWSFTRSFSSKGDQTVKASIDTDDRYKNNNQFFKTVEVTEKPEVLFIGDEGGFGREISEFYEITYRDSLPDNLEPYYSIISTKKIDSSELSSFVAAGNGFIYTGDTEKEMDVLPVTKTDRDQTTDAAKIMLAVDISYSSGDISGSVKMSKKIAYNLVEELPGNSKVGVVAYNREAYLVNKPVVLAENRQKLMSKISRLETSGPSAHDKGVIGAEEALNDTGNIIFISDGRAPDSTLNGRVIENKADDRALEAASDLNGVKLISVGVGEGRNERFLRRLAARGDGHYLDGRDAGSLKFQFSGGGAASGSSQIEVVRDHFITRGLSLNAQATNFDKVRAKSGADTVVSGRDGSPFLTTWRYGVGRVAAFSGGNEQLNLIIQEDPLLVSRSVSWTVGDPKRKQEKWIRVTDSRRPEKVKVRSSYRVKDLKRQSEDLYTKNIQPSSRGFGKFSESIYGYNYPQEYEKVGYSSEMRGIVRDTGGQVYRMNETEELKQDIKSFSSKTKVERQKLGSYLIALGLILFLAEVGYRKVKGKK